MKIDVIRTRLIKKARKSPCRFKIAAIGLDARGNPLTICFNKPGFWGSGRGIHAEMLVMKKSPPNLKRIVLVRVSGLAGNIRPISPCLMCENKANELGIEITSIQS